MSKKYPISPKDIDVSKEPKGFDTLLDYGQRCMLWGFFQVWHSKGNWDPITRGEYQGFISKMGPNTYMTCALLKWVGDRLESLLNYTKGDEEKGEESTYAPTHFLISTYFLWNPAERVFK